MHLSRRALTALVLGVAVGQLSCGREITGPANGLGGRVANISLDPRMPFTGSLFADATGISSVVPFDRVRVTAERQSDTQAPSATLAFDRTFPFPSTADSLALNLSIPLGDGDTEGVRVFVRVAYINAQGDTIFRGGPVSTFAPLGGSGEALTMPIRYTGVGSGATSVVMTPDTGTVFAGSTTVFTAQARDTTGAIAGTPLYFYSPDTARALIANPAVGSVQWKPSRGPARIIALHPDGQLADTSLFEVTFPFAKLVTLSGAAQSALAGTLLPQPIVVRTLASDDVPVPGVIVTFAVATGGGSLSIVTDTSDANGVVSTSWTLGTALGAQSITASAASAAGAASTTTTIAAQSNAGPTGISLNITSPIGASRYYALVSGGGLTTSIVAKVDAAFARTATLNVPVPAGTGYTVYVLAADSLSTLPDTLPVISAGGQLLNVNIPAGNTIAASVTLGEVSLVGTVPGFVNAGDPFVADVTLTDNSGLFHGISTFVNLYRSDTLVTTDRSGSSIAVAGMQVLSPTQKRFTASVFRPTASGVIYSQYGAGIQTADRKVIFWVMGPSVRRSEPLLTTSVSATETAIRVNITAPANVTRFVVAVDTGSGPIAWGGVNGAATTTASIEVPVPSGSNYRVRVAGLQDFNFSTLTFAFLGGLRSGGVLTGQVVTEGIADVNLTLVPQTASAGVPSTGTVGVALPFSGTMRDPSLFSATAGCLLRYSTTGPITALNLGTLQTTGCTVSNRQADGTFTVAGSFPPVAVPGQLDTHVFTSVITYMPNGSRVEIAHQSIAVTTINP